MREINVTEYHQDPVAKLTFSDGEVLVIRQPMEADFYRMQEIIQKHVKGVTVYATKMKDKALAATEEAGGDDEVGRELLEQETGEETIPVEVSVRFLSARILSLLCEPERTPEQLLDKLGPRLVFEIHAMVTELMSGDEAKKRIARS